MVNRDVKEQLSAGRIGSPSADGVNCTGVYICVKGTAVVLLVGMSEGGG